MKLTFEKFSTVQKEVEEQFGTEETLLIFQKLTAESKSDDASLIKDLLMDLR